MYDADQAHVYILTLARLGSPTQVIATYDTLEGAKNHYGPNSPSPCLPWRQTHIYHLPRDQWTSHFRDSHPSTVLIINKMPVLVGSR